jgi:NAD(P)-dependent dehydrogenase (short-subunit alcohol dehydrogenase family)
MTGQLDRRTAIITGASQGLGRAIARAFVTQGASVMICARNRRALEHACTELTSVSSTHQKVLATVADVSRPEDVERLVSNALAAFPQVHALINNAGVYGPLGAIESVDWGAWERALAINLYGSVLPCRALVPHFKSHRYGKIVQLSGGGATNPLPNISAYAASKAAVVRFAETLAEELRGHGIDVNSMAPGVLDTRLLDEVIAVGPGRVGAAFHQRMVDQKAQGGTPLEKATDLAVFLASGASDGITGKLLSAVWDPWKSMPEHRDELNRSDVYTLRRIVPKDRDFDWD